MLNNFVATGRFPNFESQYKEGDTPFIMWSLSVRRDYKPKGAEFYPEDLIPIRAFGPTAKFIKEHFQPGSNATIIGRLEKSENYVDKDGVQQYGQLYINVSQIYFGDNGGAGKDTSNESKPANKTATQTSNKKNPFGGGATTSSPFAAKGGQKKNPFA